MSRGVTLKAADRVLTQDDALRECTGCDIRIEDGIITDIGPDVPPSHSTIDARGTIVTPGLVNTHHHLYQTQIGRASV